ncbi:inositol hexakisphosphate and diphosphoinositol-pentakisphosphate kinase 2 [Elysia marginata]|uniref:Inositol hexakisphosphate and diphosphoinositol-pentakisphosphate kinase 2 n=1 Tax=Elysia marginata TaxID=1093978 RepID=A0AAV4G1J8_9GAST|nr:inositol hexakisphosphate and diphosphoinositol-pentakisphosphate kinase 2 [Elysia marginata]
MGSFDGAETCELVGLYLLPQLQHLDIKVGLYRDDGLAVTNKSPQQTENIKKQMCAIFKDNGLNITIQANQKIVDFLDVTFNLHTGLHKPYKKPNHRITYIHIESNHPPSIIKNLPQGIEKRVTNNSSTAKIFEDAAIP